MSKKILLLNLILNFDIRSLAIQKQTFNANLILITYICYLIIMTRGQEV